MHYYCQTFQQKFKDEIVAQKTAKLQQYHQQPTTSAHGLLKLPVSMLYSILQSDELRVEDENTVLSFVFHYCKIKTTETSLEQATKAANQLVKCLRFNFLSFYNVISAIRKNEALQLSEVFVDAFTQEFFYRLKMGKLDIMNTSTQTDEFTQHQCGKVRKHFSLMKIEQQGRSKLQGSDKGIHIAMFEEMMEWALKSKTETDQKVIQHVGSSSATDYQVRVLNQQVYDERMKKERLNDELRHMTTQYNQVLNQLKQMNVKPQQTYTQPPQTYVPPPQAQYVPPVQKENIAPAPSVPAYMQHQQKLQVQPKPADSFDSMLLNQTLNLSMDVNGPGGTVAQNQLPMNRPSATNPARRKPPAFLSMDNSSADLSAIINKLNDKKGPTASSKYLVGGNRGKGSKNDCTIF